MSSSVSSTERRMVLQEIRIVRTSQNKEHVVYLEMSPDVLRLQYFVCHVSTPLNI